MQWGERNDENWSNTSIQFSSPKIFTTSQPVTYTWENIGVEAEVVEGSCRNKKTTRKRILDNGMLIWYYAALGIQHSPARIKLYLSNGSRSTWRVSLSDGR